MEKISVLEELNAMAKKGCEIAVVAITIKNANVVVANEKVLVRLVESPKNESEINNADFYELFDSISDFEKNTYYRSHADETYNIDYISDFVWVADFNSSAKMVA